MTTPTSLLSDLVDRVLRLADRVDTAYRGRALTALDESLQWHSRRVPWDSLLKTEIFRASGRDLILPDRVHKVVDIGDADNKTYVAPGDQWLQRAPDSWLANTPGRAYEWRDQGYVCVTAQPATDSHLAINSTVSEGLDVTIRGLVRDTTASGTALEYYEALEVLTLADETTVTSSNAYVEVLAVQKPKFTTAEVLVANALSGARISRIPSWETRPLFQRVQFNYSPTVGTRFEVNYFRRPDRLTAETQTIDPGVNEEALLWRATGNLLFIDKQDQGAAAAWANAERIVEELRAVEEKFGERDLHVEPWVGYQEIERSTSDWSTEFYD